MKGRAVQSSTTSRTQEVTKRTSVGDEDGFIDMRVSVYPWPSGGGGEVFVRMDVKHAVELHRELGARITTAKGFLAREQEARRRNAARDRTRKKP